MSFYPVVLSLYSGLLKVSSSDKLASKKMSSNSSSNSKMPTTTDGEIQDANPVTKFMLCQDLVALNVFIYGLLTFAKLIKLYGIVDDDKQNEHIHNIFLVFIASVIGHTAITAIACYSLYKKIRGFLLVFIIWNTTYKGIVFGILLSSLKDIYNYFCSSTSSINDCTTAFFSFTFIFGIMGLEAFRTIVLVNCFNKMKPKKNEIIVPSI